MKKTLLKMSIATFLLLLPLIHFGRGPDSGGSAYPAAVAAIICPPGADFECFSDIPAPDVSAVVVSDFCGTPTIVWTGDTNSGDNCANGMVIRTYAASDDCGNYMECTQELTYSDNTAPVFDQIVTDITVQCPEDVPPMVDIASTDNCTTAPFLWAFDDMLAYGDTTCVLTDAAGPGVDWSMVLFNLPGSSDYFVFDTPGSMELYADGTAMITGTVQANNNPDQQWMIIITLENKRSWSEWSALGRDYKDDLMLAGDNYLDWSYYELDNDNSFLIGLGDFAGSFLQLSHMPASYLYGFQIGIGANNKNANYGMSGWFHYDGVHNGASVSGHGDINVDNECETSSLIQECLYTIDRQWITVDDCGNVAIMNQTITVDDTTPPAFTAVPENLVLDCYDEVPSVDLSALEAVDNCGGPVVITFEGEVLEGNSCEGTLTRTFAALDNCDNLSLHIQTISFDDDSAPVLSGVPADLDLSCEEAIPAPANVTANDNCDGAVTVVFSEENVQGECPNEAVITRTWSATDECGNGVSAEQIITISDDIAPVITNCPSDITVDCYADVPVPNVALVAATDNCGDVSIVHIGDVQTGDECTGTIVRTYRATDECGNSADCVQTITYDDNEAPVFVNPPANTIANCDDLPDPADVVAIDNCSEVTIVYTETLFSGGCLGDLQRIWVATDACGNSATYEQFITLIDTVAPILHDLPANASYECDEVIPAPAAVTATDNCDASVIVNFEESVLMGNCPEAYTIFRTWSAIDTCENAVSYTQVISVDDTTAPLFDVENAEQTVDCDAQINIVTPGVTDNCDANPTVELSTSTIDGDCPNAWTEIYTWTATDNCGNSSSVSLTINYVDETAPVFTSVPEAITVECDEIIPATVATASDNCGDVVVTSSDSALLDDECAGYIIRTFTATDECGNTATATQIINIIDTTAPVITACPADASYDCIDDVPAPNTALVSASDNCSSVSIVHVGDVQIGDECIGSITRTYRAIDECGNSADCVQVLSYEDNVAPVFVNAPISGTYDCMSVPDPSEVEAIDNCSEVTVTFTETEMSGGCPGTIYIVWTATDECGNTAMHEQFINLIDTVAPVFQNLPENITIECDEALPPVAEVTAIDNCDDSVIVEFSETSEAGNCPQAYTVFRTWTATDTCENSVSYTQVITIEDTTAPIFDMEDSIITVDCDETASVVAPSAFDNCDADVEITSVVNTFDGDCPNEWTEVWTWTATDDCGNSSSVSLTINYVDETAPVFTSVPDDINVECDETIPASVATASDDCGDVVVTSSDSALLDDECAGYIIRTFTATDECGNTATATQTINIIDTTAPVITACPADASYDCIDDVPAPNTALVSAIDNCSSVSIVHISDVESGDACSGSITRTYRAIDECGNSVDCVQIMSYVDTIAPVFVNPPANAALPCDSIPDASELVAIDNCGAEVTVTYEEFLFSGGCLGDLHRIWVATDECGNSTTYEQFITLIDQTAPVFANLPANAAYECDEAIPAPANVTATDNCDEGVTVEFSETTEAGDCVNSYTIFRTWTATDTCENSVSHTQVITIDDTTAPVLSGEDDEITMDCASDYQLPVITATDNCDADVDVTLNTQTVNGDCPAEMTEIHTWTAVDDCGNSAVRTLVVNYVDDTAPVFTQTPGNLAFDCIDDVPAPNTSLLTAVDNCGDVTISFIGDMQFGDDCEAVINRVYRATDECGNFVDFTQTIGINDNIAPTFDQSVQNMTVECDAVPAPANIMASDNCTVLVSVSLSEQTQDGECEGSYILTRTWTATDDCDNSSTLVQTITVEDTTPPTFVDVPEDTSYFCDDEIPVSEAPEAIDNCSAVTVTSEQFIEGYVNEDGMAMCELTTPLDVVGAAWALWLPNTIGEPQFYYLTEAGGQFNELPNGQAHLTGTVYAPSNPGKRWVIDVYFEQKKDWDEWSALGRSYKDDAGVAGNLYETWDYYIMNATNATLTGEGLYAGSLLNLTHAPASYFFGFQVGEAANNRNAADGMSGWFFYNGIWLGNTGVNGIGDFGFESDCPECDYTITNIWTATDDCGNSTSAIQVITVQPDPNGDNTPELEVLAESSAVMMKAWPNPASSQTRINFMIPVESRVTLEIYNTDGKLMESLFTGVASANTEYSFDFEAGNLSNGMYIYKLTTDKATYLEKLMITK